MMSMVDAMLMSSAVKDHAKNQPFKLPSYAVGGTTSEVSLKPVAVTATTTTTTFKAMCDEFKAQTNNNVGCMFIVLDKDWYQPGSTVEGRVFFDLFMPCFQNRVMLKLEGIETMPLPHIDYAFSEDFMQSGIQSSQGECAETPRSQV